MFCEEDDDIEPTLRRRFRLSEFDDDDDSIGDVEAGRSMMFSVVVAVDELRCFCAEDRFRPDVFDIVSI